MPNTSSRGLMFYLKTLQVAMEDGVVTDEEAAILDILAQCIGVSKGTKKFAHEIFEGVEKSPVSEEEEEEWSCRHIGDATCYQSLLIAALDDDEITDDEMAMLDYLRKAMNLQPNEHALVEEAVRSMIENQGDERLMMRLNSYMASYPGA